MVWIGSVLSRIGNLQWHYCIGQFIPLLHQNFPRDARQRERSPLFYFVLSSGPRVFYFIIWQWMPVPVAARSKAQVYGRSPAAIVGSNSTGTWMFFCCGCCVLSSRGLCDGLITRPEESYRLWRVVVCDHETSYGRRLQPRQWAAKYKPTMGVVAPVEKKNGIGYHVFVHRVYRRHWKYFFRPFGETRHI